MKQLLARCKEKTACLIQKISFCIKSFFAETKNRIAFTIISLASIACMVIFLLMDYHVPYALLWTALIWLIAFLIVRKKWNTLSGVLWWMGPFLAFISVEYMIGNITYLPFTCAIYKPIELILNLVWYYMLAGLLYLAFGRKKPSAIVTAVFFLLIGLVDSYFFVFRGRVIFPSDFLALRTAVNVIGEYNFMPSVEQVFGTLTMLAYIAAIAIVPCEKGAHRPKWYITVPSVALCAGYICLFFFTPFLKWTGFEDKLWTSLWQTKQNGVVLNFTVNLRFSSVEKPEGYDERIDALLSENESEDAILSEDAVKPNIIAIMNESFCDLSVIGIETNESCTPFIDSLNENTVKGYAYVSVFGGHTANSEYEFLTGNSVSYLPVGTVAYQMFTHENDYSLARQLNSLGYYSIAMHPYDKSGWNRTSVYNRYDFDEMFFIDEFLDVVNIRDYCSDKSNYDNVIRTYEEHITGEKSDSPLFLFNVTMQNHGGYEVNWSGLEKTVWLTGALEGKYESVDMYLSLARESDAAFEELVAYFETVSEPTVIVMFGDHHPSLSRAFYTKVFGKSKDTLTQEESTCLYQVPYVIWANYDIEETVYGDFSLNYLSTVLLDVLDYPMTGYQQFLMDAIEVLPVITRNFYMDSTGKWSGNAAELSADAQEMISAYSILQYNGLKSSDAREDSFFNLKTSG